MAGSRVDIHKLLQTMVDNDASDLHLTAGTPPALRIHGSIRRIKSENLTEQDTHAIAYSILSERQKKKFEQDREIDLSFSWRDTCRFRANFFWQRGAVAGALRQIPSEVIPLENLGVPDGVHSLVGKKQGLVFVTGPTGSGKSTTLASIIDAINRKRRGHIITIEDPIEFIHNHQNCIVNQREVGSDTESFSEALRYVLRQDPDVVLIGEIRDLASMEAALRISETGHLAFATMHTNSAIQTIHRAIEFFPSEHQASVRHLLSFVLEGVVSQRLLPGADKRSRMMASELLLPTPAIRNLIREEKTHQIYSLMQSGHKTHQMQTLNQSLARLVESGKITREVALQSSYEKNELLNMMDRSSAIDSRPGEMQASKWKGNTMASFVWEGRTRDGEVKQGYMDASNSREVQMRLADMQIQNVKVRKRTRGINLDTLFYKVSTKTIVVFTRQMATMIDAGLPLVQCLELLQAQEPDKNFQKVLLHVKNQVESGTTFADALRKHPKTFDNLFINLVAAGEMGGILDTILNRLADYVEKSMKLKAKVKGAMKYPITVLIWRSVLRSACCGKWFPPSRACSPRWEPSRFHL